MLKHFHPGEYIVDLLEAKEISKEEFSQVSNIPLFIVSGLIDHSIDIDLDIATKLSQYLGTSITLWLNLQKSYDQYIAQLAQR